MLVSSAASAAAAAAVQLQLLLEHFAWSAAAARTLIVCNQQVARSGPTSKLAEVHTAAAAVAAVVAGIGAAAVAGDTGAAAVAPVAGQGEQRTPDGQTPFPWPET